MTSLQGQLLVAVPKLRDAGFFHSVVVMIRHTAEGAFGLALNRPGDRSLSEIWPQISADPCPRDQPLFTGGPVPGPLMVLHDVSAAAELEIFANLYFTMAPDRLASLIADAEAHTQLFSGYCGWGAGQLESEMEVGSWLTFPASSHHIFSAGDELWNQVTEEITSSAVFSTLKIKHRPPESDCN